MSGLPSPAKILLLVVAGCLAGLALAEGVVRILGAAPEVAWLSRGQFRIASNVLVGWEPIPNPASTGSTLEPRWTDDQRNSLGYRDYEHSVGKVEGIYRVAVLGDSVAKGLFVDPKEGIFPSVVERKLNEAGVRAEVLSFGVEGYNTRQEVETLKDRGLRYAPDLVVLAYVLNDRDWPAHHLYRELLEEERGTGRVSATRVPPLLGWSALYRFLRFRVFEDPGGAGPSGAAHADGDRGPRAPETAASSGKGPAAGVDARIQALIDLVQADTVEPSFAELAELAARHRFGVLVVVFPWMDEPEGERGRDQRAWVESLSRRHGFHHLDLAPVMTRCRDLAKEPIAVDEIHPNAIGHYCAGWETARVIREEILARRGVSP